MCITHLIIVFINVTLFVCTIKIYFLQDVRSIPDKCSHEQRIGNSSPFNNTELLTDSNRNTSPKHNSYRILDLSGHSGPTVNKSFQISQLDSGSRPVCHSTSCLLYTSRCV